MHDVFISYSSKDTAIAERVRDILETNKISCWIAPRDIPGGSNYAREIPAAIRSCSVFLLIMSRQAQDSIWVIRELDRAVNERKVVIPLMVEDVHFRDEFDFYLTGYHRYQAYEQTAEVMKDLVKRILVLIGHPTSPDADKAPAVSPAAKQPQSLRYDGFYMTAAVNGFRTIYRFYPDGTMVSSYTCATPAQAKQWLNKKQYEGGEFIVNGEEIRVIDPLSDGHTYNAKVSFTQNGIILQGFNSWNQQEVTTECSFLAFSDMT